MMKSSDSMHILEYPQFVFQFLNPFYQVIVTHNRVPPFQ